jgi:hypothetical protein
MAMTSSKLSAWRVVISSPSLVTMRYVRMVELVEEQAGGQGAAQEHGPTRP